MIFFKKFILIFPLILLIVNLFDPSLTLGGYSEIRQNTDLFLNYKNLIDTRLIILTIGFNFSFYTSLAIEGNLWKSLILGNLELVHFKFSLILSSLMIIFIFGFYYAHMQSSHIANHFFNFSELFQVSNHIWMIYILVLILSIFLNGFFLLIKK